MGSVDPLVVVGASAGGIEALSRFVASLPADLAAPVVIAQHLDPTRPSHLAEILARQSALPVRSVEPREALVPGTIFVVPSNRHVTITDHHVDVHPDSTRRPTPSVDLLLATAAETFGERLIAIILTGSGSDGAAGAHAVKEAGGTVIIQDPETAAFPSMPRALAPSLVDLSLPIDEIGTALVDLLAAPLSGQGAAPPDLQPLLARLHERHGIDFSAYKSATIIRRLWRRMAAARTPTITDYLEYLEAHPEEEQRLIADFLIKVTRFFRDPALFARLREEIIPELVAAARKEHRELRLWSAGCATGEEAYSLALLVAEMLDLNPDLVPPVRIFATDLDESALTFARHGVFPASALADVPVELVERYFTRQEGTVEITKAVRSLIVFGTHDLGQRPPFPGTDLILCRNVLIYFAPVLQRRALEIFAYSLREGGVLVLGSAESPGAVSAAFDTIDRRLRIYRRHGPRLALPAARLPPSTAVPLVGGTPPTRNRSALEQAHVDTEAARVTSLRAEELIRQLPIGVVIVNQHYDLELINGAARELLGVHGLALGQDLIHLAQQIPSTPFRSAIDAALANELALDMAPIATTDSATGETRYLTVRCYPDRQTADGTVETVLILVTDVTLEHLATLQAETRLAAVVASSREEADRTAAELAALRDTAARQATANRQLLAANRELTDTIDRLREHGDELRVAAAAAQVAAEEIETLNEELQSSNEELETLHEEAQATVEELNVANDELHARSTELEIKSQEHAELAETLRALSRRLLLVQEEERRNLARELHDEIGQVLTGLSFQLASAGSQNGDSALDEARTTVQAITSQVRQLSLELRPVVLDSYGLLSAIQWYAGRYQTRTGITVDLRHDGSDRRYPPEIEIAAYRVIQEALTNIARHAGVTEAWVTLVHNGSLLVVIHDQGRGFTLDQHMESSGRSGMRERVELLGGTFVLETAPGEGVRITAEFPLDNPVSVDLPKGPEA